MKAFKKLVVITAFTLVSFTSFAQSITASATTLEDAELKIAKQAEQAGASYKITSARFTNGTYMSAELVK